MTWEYAQNILLSSERIRLQKSNCSTSLTKSAHIYREKNKKDWEDIHLNEE